MRIKDENKERTILQKALELIVNQGFDGLSMHKLAKSANVSAATIYIYFKDRDDLIIQLYKNESTKMFQATLENFSPDMSFEEGLRTQWFNRARYCLQNSDSMHFMEQIKYSPLFEKAKEHTDKSFHNIMQRFVHQAITKKQLIELPFELYWSIAFAPLYQLVKFHLSQVGPRGRAPFTLSDEKIEQMVSIVLKALRP